MAILTLSTLNACHIKTPEEVAKESFEKEIKEMEQKTEARKHKCDSLYRLAAGYNPETTKLTRMMACQELEEEVPELNLDYEALKQAIRKDRFFEYTKKSEDN